MDMCYVDCVSILKANTEVIDQISNDCWITTGSFTPDDHITNRHNSQTSKHNLILKTVLERS